MDAFHVSQEWTLSSSRGRCGVQEELCHLRLGLGVIHAKTSHGRFISAVPTINNYRDIVTSDDHTCSSCELILRTAC